MDGIVGTIIGGIALIAGVYIALEWSKNLQSEAGQFTKSYTKVAKTFQGG